MAVSANSSAVGPLLRNTYLGTSDSETAYAMVQAPDGTYYVTGLTNSRNFPGVDSGFQSFYGGGKHDIFVAHLSWDLSRLIQATYIGGRGDDTGYGIAFDETNNSVYVVGSTTSPRLLGTWRRAQPYYAGGGDTVVVRLTANLKYAWTTYLGGSGDDTPSSVPLGSGRTTAIAVSPENGNIYVAGFTASTDFPATGEGMQPAYGGGGSDAYVAMLTPDLKTIVRATYLGGSDADVPYGMVVVPGNGIFLTGATASPDLPAANGFQPELAGRMDSFVAHLDADLRTRLALTYFGGARLDEGRAVAVDPFSDTVYISGFTYSTDLPGAGFGAQPNYAGRGDAFVAALSPDLSSLVNSSYIGGAQMDAARPSALVLNPTAGVLYVSGITLSTDFPETAGGVQPNFPQDPVYSYNSFISELTIDLTQIVQSTYLGGSQNHTGTHGLLIDRRFGGLMAVFGTGAYDLPNTSGAYQPYFAGGTHDAAVGSFPPDLQNQ